MIIIKEAQHIKFSFCSIWLINYLYKHRLTNLIPRTYIDMYPIIWTLKLK